MPFRIVVVNASGYGNAGDDALNEAIFSYLREQFPRDFVEIERKHPADPLPDCDFLIIGGGGLIYEEPFANVENYTGYAFEAKKRGVPYCYFGIGVQSPIRKSRAVEAYRKALSSALFVSVRNPHSLNRLKEIGIHSFLGEDTGWLLNLGNKGVESSNGVRVGLAARNFPEAESIMEKHLRGIVSSLKGYDLLLFSQSRVDDDEVMERLSEELGAPLFKYSEMEGRPSDFFSLLGSVDVLVSSRFHSALYALKMGVPVVGMTGGGGKLFSLLSRVGLDDYMVRKTETERVGEKVEKMLRERSTARQRIASSLPLLMEKCRENYRLLMEYLYPSYLEKAYSSSYYNERSTGWSGGYREESLRGAMESFLDECREKGMHPEGKTLVVGCAKGLMVKILKERGVEATGVEVSADAVREKMTERVVQGSILSVPFGDSSFSCTVCSDVLEHVPRVFLQRALGELSRVTESLVIVKVPGPRVTFDPTHISLFDRDEWLSLLSSKFFLLGETEWAGNFVFFLKPRKVLYHPGRALER